MSHREYGHHVGIFRVLDVRQTHGIRPTIAMDASTALNYPYLVAYLRGRGYEIVAYGIAVTERTYPARTGTLKFCTIPTRELRAEAEYLRTLARGITDSTTLAAIGEPAEELEHLAYDAENDEATGWPGAAAGHATVIPPWPAASLPASPPRRPGLPPLNGASSR